MSQIVDDLRQVAIEIKTETQVGGNTAARVGGAFERVADALEGTQQIEDMDAAVAAVQQAAQENEQTIQDIVNSLAVVQTTGQSTSDVMSQKAVTDEIMTSPQSWDLSYGGDFTWELGAIHNDNGKAWSSTSYYHIYIPVSNLQGGKVKLTAQPTKIVDYAFLNIVGFLYTNVGTNISAYYSSGYNNVITIPAGQEATFVIPNDCNYLYIACGQISGDVRLPQSNSYYTYKWGDVVQTTGDSTHAVMSQKAVTDAIPKQTKVLFQNSSNVQWLSGNVASNGTIVTNYANRYFRLLIPEGVEYLKYERTTLDSGFSVAGYVSTSATSGYTNAVASTQTYKKVDVRGYKYFLLLCWDKPTLEQVQSINITLSNTKLATEIGITKDYFDETQSSVPSMAILSPMAKNVYVKKFITGDGITWEQGGINSSTGAEEKNSKAIRTNAIYLNGDASAVVSISDIPNYTAAIVVYDSDGTFKAFQTSGFNNLYPNGYIRFCLYGGVNILPEKGTESGVCVIRHGELEFRVSKLEQRAFYIEQSALTYFNNPVIRSESNADPAVWYGEDGYWYLFATGTLATKTMWRSANLVDWENTGETPFTQAAIETWTNLGNSSFWAPEIVKVGNKWNLYLSAPQNPMYVFSSDHPTFGYEYVGVIANRIFGGNHENIDACVRYDRDGTLWLFLDGSTVGMYRVKLNEDGTSVISNTLEHVAGLPSTASGNVNREKTYEGAYLYRRKGYWYLIVSAGDYRNSSYCLRVGRSATLNGTFVDKEGNPMTEGNASLLLSSTGTFYGTGHNGSIITDKNNKTWMLFHSYWTSASSSTRLACISEVLWDNDGWPYFENNTLTIEGFGPTM